MCRYFHEIGSIDTYTVIVNEPYTRQLYHPKTWPSVHELKIKTMFTHVIYSLYWMIEPTWFTYFVLLSGRSAFNTCSLVVISGWELSTSGINVDMVSLFKHTVTISQSTKTLVTSCQLQLTLKACVLYQVLPTFTNVCFQ